VGLVLCVLSFGNPQWNRWVYVWQEYVIEKNGGGILHMPVDYSGTWNMWERDGTLVYTINFLNGINHGYLLIYHGNGNIHTKDNWVNGQMNGPSFSYFPNGNIDTVSGNKDGKIHGRMSSYYENGFLRFVCTFVDGDQSGLVRYYSNDGKVNSLMYVNQNPNGTGAKETYIYSKDENIDNRKKYAHLLKDHPELLENIETSGKKKKK